MPSPPTGVSFRVEVPTTPVECKTTFSKWLLRHGRMQSEEVEGEHHACTFDTNKFVRQNNLLRSMRTAFARAGLSHEHLHLSTIKLPRKTAPTADERVHQLEVNQATMAAELNELRLMVGRPTTINNNIIILNFGHEDMSHLQPPLQYLERAFTGLRELLKEVYFNDGMPQNNTVRINLETHAAEISNCGGWKPIALPEAASKMIEKCGHYMLSAYDSERHKENDEVMDFGCSLRNPGEGQTAMFKDEIHHELLSRAKAEAQR